MARINTEMIEKAKRVGLKDYLEVCEPQELARASGTIYCTRTHDSLRIFSDGDWYWFSQGIGGRGALDYLIKVKEMTFHDAVEAIVGKNIEAPTTEWKPINKEKKLVLPEKNQTSKKVFAYLAGRGIDPQIISYCMKQGIVYESAPYRDVVFVGKDASGKPKYAARRATNQSRGMNDCSGSDKQYAFRIVNDKGKSVHVFEAAIDLLSYATLAKMKMGTRWNDLNYLSLGGVAAGRQSEKNDEGYKAKLPKALQNFLDSHPEVDTVYLHLDADEPGRNATEAIKKSLGDEYHVFDVPPPSGKDFNEYLTQKYPPKRIESSKKYGRDSQRRDFDGR